MTQPVTLYTSQTPNGFPISIALEELGVPYEVKTLNLRGNEQKTEWFLKINPNGLIPAIVDHQNEAGDFAVFETSAILFYLAQHYDKERRISYDPVLEPNLHSEELQWTFFAHGGIGSMQAQAIHFLRYAPEKIPYAIKRYQDETIRLFSILETRLQDREWLVGPHYSLADIKTFPWAKGSPWAGVDLTEFPNIEAWVKRCEARPATYAGLGVPGRIDIRARLAEAEEFSVKVRETFKFEEEKKG